MESSRVLSPPSILVHDFNGMNGRPGNSSSRSVAKAMPRAPPMMIPNAQKDDNVVPPPLPPPRYIDDFAAGSDPGWKWGNTPNHGGFGGKDGGLVNSISSWDHGMEEEVSPDRPGNTRRGSSTTTIKSRPEGERKYDFSRQIDEGYHSLSGSSISNHRLHGERQLGQLNIESSAQAYDNKLLSKIGKEQPSPKTSRTGSLDASPTSTFSYYQSGRNPQPLKSLSISEGTMQSYSEPRVKREPQSSRFGDSPRSRAISPSLLSSAASAKSFMDWRSPIYDGSTPSSAVSESQIRPQQSRFNSFSSHYQRQQSSRRSGSGSVFSNYDESAGGSSVGSEYTSRGSKRGSQDQSVFGEPDYMEETGAMRQLHLEDRAPLSFDTALQYSSSPVTSSDSRQGMKRKAASSPPPDASHEDKAPLHSAGSSSERSLSAAYPANRASPVNRFGQQHGSISSASSTGPRNGSYASSTGLSVGSSLTSLSSTNQERLSPTSEYPHPPQPQHPYPDRDSPYIASLSVNPSPRSPLSQPHQRPPVNNKSAALTVRKMSADSQAARNPNNPPNLQAHILTCRCCPKKPKKFDTEEELRAHESEKQYFCHFCHNRFKNKNEAERHQNSLHLRRHSWSCATLAGSYERVFRPSTSIPSQHPNQPPPPMDAVAPFDICGYCGQEFPNEPQPDWNDRIQHLTSIHKFGECNQSKKFFRADHFRQHLKHSHAGTSGKWTNSMEDACKQDEPPPVAPDVMQQAVPMQQGPSMQQAPGAPVANMGIGTGPAPNPGQSMNMMGGPGLGNDSIAEMKEEM
ncbi:MAG: hypothetical protein LQ351_006477 [Letrouitia transgressa]|nr:MAG: hypothetical protein LQ351_006477 [Letrouitia transgressa]